MLNVKYEKKKLLYTLDQFQYIKIRAKPIDLSTRLCGITIEFFPQIEISIAYFPGAIIIDLLVYGKKITEGTTYPVVSLDGTRC